MFSTRDIWEKLSRRRIRRAQNPFAVSVKDILDLKTELLLAKKIETFRMLSFACLYIFQPIDVLKDFFWFLSIDLTFWIERFKQAAATCENISKLKYFHIFIGPDFWGVFTKQMMYVK